MEYTSLSSSHGTFSRVAHTDQKTSLNKFKKTEIIPNIFSEHNVKLEINYKKKKLEKNTNMWRLKNMPLSHQ